MTDYKHCCCIDQSGNYITFVLVLLEPNETGEIQENIQYYTLKDGEKLLDASPPSSFLKPRWDGEAWEETATAEELALWEQSKPTFPQPSPTPSPIPGEIVSQQISDLEAALTLQRQVTDNLLISALEV